VCCNEEEIGCREWKVFTVQWSVSRSRATVLHHAVRYCCRLWRQR